MSRAFKDYPFEFMRRSAARGRRDPVELHRVAIVGGGVAGLAAALGLAAQGIASVVLEADETVCFGSRAICISRRSLDIFDRYGAAGPMLEKGLAWDSGRCFHRDREVLRFSMADDAGQKHPPMINIQQYYLEEFLVRALERHPELVQLRWGSRVTDLRAHDEGVELLVQTQDGDAYRIDAQWVLACDGGRSQVREVLGLHLHGTAYEGRYVIVDIAMKCDLPTERLAWFDPDSNRGSTILMHRQPDDIWRIDYQLRDDEDPQQAIQADHVLPRVQAHLEMMGLTAPWAPLWISLYKANALTLDDYRHGRVLFAGDAAHLVPIFGVRGANSAIDDVDNLAWRLGYVLRGVSPPALLDTYSRERVQAARENLANGMKSTEFMAPPSFAFRWMREAVLDLAVDHPAVRSLINPRQTTAARYDASAAHSDDGVAFAQGPSAGNVMADARLERVRGGQAPQAVHLTELVRPGTFLLLQFGPEGRLSEEVRKAVDELVRQGVSLQAHALCSRPPDGPAPDYLLDVQGAAAADYDAATGACYVVRPDGYVLGRWRVPKCVTLVRAVLRELCAVGAMEEA